LVNENGPTAISAADLWSRLEQIVAGRVAHDRLLEQLAKQHNGRPLETAKSAARGRCSIAGSDVIGHLLLLRMTSISFDDLAQSDLPQRSNQQLLHPMI